MTLRTGFLVDMGACVASPMYPCSAVGGLGNHAKGTAS